MKKDIKSVERYTSHLELEAGAVDREAKSEKHDKRSESSCMLTRTHCLRMQPTQHP